jgi:hypothetical protein
MYPWYVARKSLEQFCVTVCAQQRWQQNQCRA